MYEYYAIERQEIFCMLSMILTTYFALKLLTC